LGKHDLFYSSSFSFVALLLLINSQCFAYGSPFTYFDFLTFIITENSEMSSVFIPIVFILVLIFAVTITQRIEHVKHYFPNFLSTYRSIIRTNGYHSTMSRVINELAELDNDQGL